MVPPKLTLVPPSGGSPASQEPTQPGANADEQQFAERADEAFGDAHGETSPSTVSVSAFPSADHAEKLRIVEALLFASPEPLGEEKLASHLGADDDINALLDDLQSYYEGRGINLVRVSGKWAFRTAHDLAYLLKNHTHEQRRLSKAALETLAIIAYHQPVTRAEIEEIRAVTTSVGTLDILLETGWTKLRGRRRAPGRPVTYGTSEAFLSHFGLDSIKDLPGLAELKGSGLLSNALPAGFSVPEPTDVAALMPDELPLDATEDEDEDEDENEDDDRDGDIDGDDNGVDHRLFQDLPDPVDPDKPQSSDS